MIDRLKKAHTFAVAAHGDQKRLFSGKPYIVHPEETAQLLWEVTSGKATVDDYIAAILHDVIEDTDVALIEIKRHFGDVVMNLVDELTTNQKQKEKLGKAVYLTEKINNMSSRALTIKLCDRLSNVVALDQDHAPKAFVKKYVQETTYILNGLTRPLNDDQKYLTDRLKKMLLYLTLNRGL